MAKQVKTRGGGSLTSEQFLLREMKIVATLRLQGLSDEEIIQHVVKENPFQYPSATHLRRNARVCLARLDAFDCGVTNIADKLTVVVADGRHDAAAQANMYAMMRVYPLVKAFMVECVGERMLQQNFSFARRDINAFFTRLEVENPAAAAWTESTEKRIKSTLWNLLVQSDYLPSRNAETLQRPLLDPDVRDCIVANGDGALLVAYGEGECL